MIIVLSAVLFVALVGGLAAAYYAQSPGRHSGAGVGAYNARTLANPARSSIGGRHARAHPGRFVPAW
ncbi:hypothetical protein [Saccharopolyspora elongata]|uniref:Uncharacterized protein n=1 Tax=Saccharopolyspora elongata TaxID=2530387 RepID=A0A4R4Y7A8_9PSEU|nr:hypothetical protein [Saccharopolyspora elongata]TDD40301.1 hypothetical protein E1288_35825 [Saccharopolyspora elongata]